MLSARGLQGTFLGLSLLAAVTTSCSIPGIRPEGRTLTTSAIAPASRPEVYARVKDWFARHRYTIVHDAADSQLRGHSTIRTEGDVETRAVIDFAMTSSTSETTNYRVTGHSERGRPPAMTPTDQNAPETVSAVSSLVAWLSCPAARWPRCP
jgi:hypothetical protein